MNPRVLKPAGASKRPSFPYRAIMKIIAVAVALLSVVSSQAANIVWVSFHSGDDTPTAAASTRGYTRAPDVGYTELLRNSGHTVTRIVTRDNIVAGTPEDAIIQTADLVIISRSVASGHYQQNNETAYFNGLAKPMIIVNAYITRGGTTAGNVRLGLLQSSTIPDVNTPSVRLRVNNPSHPIFAGVALDGANLMVNSYAHIIIDSYGTHRGISVVTGTLAGGGTVLATVGSVGDAAFGGAVVAEWPAGATMDTTLPDGPADILGGRRLLILTGSREPNITGTSSEVAGIYDLDPDGARMFLNAVDYMAPKPSYERAVRADGPLVYYRFSDAGTTAANAGSIGAAGDGTYLNGAVSGAEAPRSPQFVGFEADNVAAQLDGVDDFVQGPMRLLNNLSNVTLSAWIRRAGAQRGRTGIIGQDNVIEYGYIDNNTLQAWVDDFATPINTPTPFPDLEWDHVALVVNGATLQMTSYTNGQAAGSAPLPSAFYDSLNAQTALVVGGDAFGNGVSFNGQIDEAAVFDKALSAQQVANHYYSAVASAPIIIAQPEGTNLFEGETIRLSVGAVGTPNLRYQWLYFGSPIAGKTAATLTIPNALPEHSGTYSVRVENTYGSAVSADAEVNVQPTQPPIITREPQDVRRYAGRTAAFSVTAIGGLNLEYQWTHEGMALANETNRTLTINNVSAANQGVYQVLVRNAIGETPSALAELTVLTPAAGSYEALVTSGNPLAYWRLGEGSGTIAYDAWGGFDGTYSNVTLAVPGAIVGDTDTAAEFNGTSSAVRTPLSLNSTPAFTTVGWLYRGADQLARTGLWGQNDKLEFGYIDNNTIQVWTDNALNVSPNPFPNQHWDFVAVVSEGSPTAPIRIYTNGLAAGTRNHTLPANNGFTFNIGGGGIFDGTGNFFNGRLDEIAVYNRALTADEIAALYFSGAAAPPIITRQPQGTNLFEGGTINVCVTAFGSAPLSYQWYYFGAPIAGQTGPCLHIPNATPGDSGDYFVEVSNPHGTVTSAGVITIDVMPASPPAITQHPQSATRYAGTSVTFSGAATGTEPITYQWTKDGSDIPGATSSSLTLNNLQASDAGSYRLVARNFMGTATSDPATLTIIAAPAGSYTAAVLAGQPIAYWRLGESSGTTAFDYVGGNHGTYNNVALGQPGAITGDPDTAAGFDGTSSYVSTPVSLNSTPRFTALGWINRAADQASRTGLWGQNDLVEFGYIDNNTIQAWTDNGLNVSPNPIPNGQWGFLALVSDGPTISIYVNGALAGSRNHTLPANNSSLFNIGGGGIFDVSGNFFNGRIDDVALFNRALTAAEINGLYDLGANECPTAANVNVSVNQGGTANFNLSGSDANGDALTYTVTQPPAHGTVTVQIGTGAATYTPAAGYCGPDSFQYTVSDGQCSSAAATVNITVVDTTPPIVSCPADIEVLSPVPTTVTYVAGGSDTCGLASFSCSPPSGSVFPLGPTTVNCTAVNAAGMTASCSFTITVVNPNDPPVCAAALSPAECVINGNSILALDGQQACITLDGRGSSDPNGDPLTFQWTVAGQFTVDMDPSQEPQGGGTGTGSGTVSLSGNTLTINVAFSGMTANATAMHIHGPAGIGTNAGVLYGLQGIGTLGATAGTISGNITLVEGTGGFTIAQQLEQLRKGLWYINIHSSFRPGGEIRGQILPVVLGSGATVDVCLGLGCHNIELAVSDGQATTRCAIQVCVITAGDALEQCIELVDNIDLGRKNKRPLIATLKAAQAAFDRGNSEAALNQLNAFQNKVRAQIGRDDPAAAAALLDCSNGIVEAIGCSALTP